MIAFPILAAALLALSPTAPPAGITLGLGANPEFGGAGAIRVPVVLGTPRDESVAALQFDLGFDAAQLQFISVEAGPSATDAQKSAHANPLKPGIVRVIVAGLNRNAMAEGPVAWVNVVPTPGAKPSCTLNLAGVVLSDPYGNALDVRTSPDTLSLDPSGAVAVASDTGSDSAKATGMEMLLRYRALLFAFVFVVGAMYLARRAPRKGRAR